MNKYGKYTIQADNGIELVIEGMKPYTGSMASEEDVKYALLVILRKLDVIANNYKKLAGKGIAVYRTDLDNVTQIVCDMREAYDEFGICCKNGNAITIELVTEEVAIKNDMEFLTLEEVEQYELGKTMSYYTDFFGTGYWYKLM